ncbi:MAG: cytochrome P450 [Streptosporangiaceae bacterium]
MRQVTMRGHATDSRGPGTARLAPGPSLPAVVQTVLWLRDPVGFYRRCERRYGPVFRVGVVGVPGFVYVTDPELARRIFATDRDIGRAGAARRDFLEPVVGPHSLLCLDGEEWTRQRKLLGSAFHGRHIEHYRDQIAAIAADHVRRWPVGEPFELRPRMQAITLDVILRVVFGVADADRVKRLRDLVPRLSADAESADALAYMAPVPVWRRLEPLLARLPRSASARSIAVRRETDALLYDEISRRRAAHDVADRTDVLSVLLHARDAEGRGMSDVEPFGGGRRQCLGGHFAPLEMSAVIPQVLGRLHLRLAGDAAAEPARVRHVTLAPARGGQVIAEARDSVTAA